MIKHRLPLIVFLVGIAAFLMATFFKMLHLAGAVSLLYIAMIALVLAIFMLIFQLIKKR